VLTIISLHGRYGFFEYATPQQAETAVGQADNKKLDKQHTLRVNLYSDFQKYGEISEKFDWNIEDLAPQVDLRGTSHTARFLLSFSAITTLLPPPAADPLLLVYVLLPDAVQAGCWTMTDGISLLCGTRRRPRSGSTTLSAPRTRTVECWSTLGRLTRRAAR